MACDPCMDARSVVFSLAAQQHCEILKVLHNAAEKGEIEVMQRLLKREDVDVDHPLPRGSNTETALTKALRAGHLDFAKVLWKEHGCAPNGELLHALAQNGDSTDIARCCQLHGLQVDFANRVGFTPLMFAAKHGHTACIKALLHFHADIDAKSIYELTPLMLASADNREDAVRMLLQSKAQVDLSNHIGWTSLHRAAANGHIAVASRLLQAKANVNSAAKGKETSLTVATVKGHKDMIKLLLDWKANPQAQDEEAARSSGRRSLQLYYLEDSENPVGQRMMHL